MSNTAGNGYTYKCSATHERTTTNNFRLVVYLTACYILIDRFDKRKVEIIFTAEIKSIIVDGHFFKNNGKKT